MDRPSEMQRARAEPVRFTSEQYLGFPDDGRRHELIDGEHVVTPAPNVRHQELSLRLAVALSNHLAAGARGRVYTAPLDVVLSETDVVQPDILFVSEERRDIVRSSIQGAPDLVVEITSPSTRRTDEITKRRLFERAGVRKYWVVDPDIEVIKIYRRSDAGHFVRVTELARENGGVLASGLLPGFSYPLGDLFA